MEVSADASLLPAADFEDGPLEVFRLGNIDPGKDHILQGAEPAGKQRARPGDHTANTLTRGPVALVTGGKPAAAQLLEDFAEPDRFLGRDEQIPYLPANCLAGIVSADLLTGAIETDDSSLGVKD